jgi:hypothetical protein
MERADLDALIALLITDVRLSMPPAMLEYRGIESAQYTAGDHIAAITSFSIQRHDALRTTPNPPRERPTVCVSDRGGHVWGFAVEIQFQAHEPKIIAQPRQASTCQHSAGCGTETPTSSRHICPGGAGFRHAQLLPG